MDERRDPGEFYPDGRVMVRPDVAPPQMQVRWSDIQGKPDFSDIAALGEADSLGKVKDTMNTVVNKMKTSMLLLFAVGSALADIAPLYTTPNSMPGDAPLMTNTEEYVDAKVDFTTSNTQLVSTIEAATSNKADAVRMSVDGQVIVSCAWWHDDCLLTWNGFKWVWSNGRLGGSRQLTYNDGQWAFSPNVSPYAYTNAVPIYGLPESLILYQDDESVTLIRTNEVYAAATNLHPVVYMDDMDAALTNVVTKSELAATSNNVLAVARMTLRALDDDLVYEPLGMGDFEWSSNDRPDIIAALGTTQPYPGYEYDGYTEWHMDFYIGPTSYWCYAWAPTDSPDVEFSFDGWYWDEDTYEERYDYGTFTGRRQAMGYDITDPIDRFARQRDTTALYAGLATVSNLLVGETKVLRTGEPGQLGTGWGYIQSRIDDERRYWRIRVPKITVQGLGPYSASWVSSYTASNGAAAQLEALRCPTKSVTMRTSETTTNYYTGTATHSGIAANLLQMSPDWQDFNYTLRRTMGSYAADRVVAASYRLGALGGTNGQYVAGYEIGSTAQSSNHKPSFTISLDTNALLAAGFVERTVAGAMTYYRAIEPIEFCVTSYVHVGSSNYGAVDVTNRFSATVNGVGFRIPQTNESWNGTSPYFTLPVYYDYDFDLEALCSSVDEQTYYYSYTGYTNIYWSIATNYTVQLSARHAMMDQSLTVRYPSTVSSSDFAFTEYMDVFAAYYKVVTTLDPYSHMYYDPGMDATFRISVYNGVFYAEKVIDGDWRDYQGEIPPQSITNNPEQ